VANALDKNFIVIAGGPGTGKTTTVAKLLIALQQLNNNALVIKMTAPTGKAAQRLSESLQSSKTAIEKSCPIAPKTLASLPQQASTLHRLLGVKKNSHNFHHDQANQLDCDVLLVDEVSMIDLPMMSRLLRALAPTTRLILLGDANQLPSVAAGSILNDIAPTHLEGYSATNIHYLAALTGEKLSVSAKAQDHLSVLRYSHRFKEQSGIGQLATQVLAGDSETSWQLINNHSNDISLEVQLSLDAWLEKLCQRYYLAIYQSNSLSEAFAALNNFRILVANRKGEFGVEAINTKIESYLQKQQLIKIDRQGFYHGRPIMVTANDYQLNLFNGDIGLLWRDENGKLTAYFPESMPQQQFYRQFNPSRLTQIETVFAMTIHKTQGSEFAQIAILLPAKENVILSRELLYTGITRAKKHIAFYCNKDVFKQSVIKKIHRCSALEERLNSLPK
jgi:exodeoxyribonuclease V alpha subunit